MISMKKKLEKVSNVMLIASVVAVVGYTTAQIIALCFAGVVFPDTLTACWYGFWGTEIIALASIKNHKTKHNTNTGTEGVKDEEPYD